MTLLAADGATHLNQAVFPLTAYSVTWFMDGRRLLEHANDLHHVRAKLVCIACESHGGGPVYVAKHSTERVFVACPHRSQGGMVRVDRQLEIQPLLISLGWNLCCSACGEALRGDNDPATATTVRVTCPCTSREYMVPVA